MLYFLVGFMGAGKTTVGRLLAEELDFAFVDSDLQIEKENGLSVKEIFDKHGEEHFRKLEQQFISELQNENTVISCGGGLPCYNSLMEMLLIKGKVIYLKAEVPTLLQRLTGESAERPLLEIGNLEKSIGKRLEERESCYLKAHRIISTDKLNPAEIVEEIVSQ